MAHLAEELEMYQEEAEPLYANAVALSLLEAVVGEFITRAGAPETWFPDEGKELLQEILESYFTLEDEENENLAAQCTHHVYYVQVLPRLRGAQVKWDRCIALSLGLKCPECGKPAHPFWTTDTDTYVPGCSECGWTQEEMKITGPCLQA